MCEAWFKEEDEGCEIRREGEVLKTDPSALWREMCECDDRINTSANERVQTVSSLCI